MSKIFIACLLFTAKLSFAFSDCSECPEMIIVPSGSFLMGASRVQLSADIEKERFDEHEMPQHQVNIPEFAIGKFEVTQEQWTALMDTNPSLNQGPQLPVENISWKDAQDFIQKLSQKTQKKYRLPTESEWEYAARGGSKTRYTWGDNDADFYLYAWAKQNAGNTNSVGLKKPNPFGLYDMLGNASEWTEDCWNSNYQGAPTDGSAWLSGNCSLRVLRGGSCGDDAWLLSLSARDGSHPTYYRFSLSSFRVARDIP